MALLITPGQWGDAPQMIEVPPKSPLPAKTARLPQRQSAYGSAHDPPDSA